MARAVGSGGLARQVVRADVELRARGAHRGRIMTDFGGRRDVCAPCCSSEADRGQDEQGDHRRQTAAGRLPHDAAAAVLGGAACVQSGRYAFANNNADSRLPPRSAQQRSEAAVPGVRVRLRRSRGRRVLPCCQQRTEVCAGLGFCTQVPSHHPSSTANKPAYRLGPLKGRSWTR